MQQTLIALAAFAAQAYAQSYTPPTDQTFGALLTPDLTNPVTQGETFKVTWDASGHEDSTVSLVLCRGGGGNCVTDPTAIASKIPASEESYEWAVPCSLTPGKQSTATGYGMLVIEDGTGVFQYSTQFSVIENPKCGSSGSSSSSSSSTTSGGKPGPTGGASNGTHVGGYTTREGWSTEATSAVTGTVTPSVIPTETQTPVAGVDTATGSITWSTATQPTATRPTSTATGVSGAEKNAVGMMFLGAMGAAFLL